MSKESSQVIAIKDKIKWLNIQLNDALKEVEDAEKTVEYTKREILSWEEALSIVTAKRKHVKKAKEAAKA